MKNKESQEEIAEGFKKCSKCGEVKKLEEFGKDKRERFGVSYQCLECARKYDRERRLINEEAKVTGIKRENPYKKTIDKISPRICKICGIEKNIEEFGNNGYVCKSCKTNKKREDIRNDERKRQLERERGKRYRENNPDKAKENTERYRENNLDRIHIMEKDRREKYKKDPHYRMKLKLRKYAGRYIRGEDKRESTMGLLGCTVEFLLEHLQKTAINNGYLNFDIYTYDTKEFEIDHVVPLDAWNLVCGYHQKLSCHWSNLQILTAEENRIKRHFLDYIVDVEANKKKFSKDK